MHADPRPCTYSTTLVQHTLCLFFFLVFAQIVALLSHPTPHPQIQIPYQYLQIPFLDPFHRNQPIINPRLIDTPHFISPNASSRSKEIDGVNVSRGTDGFWQLAVQSSAILSPELSPAMLVLSLIQQRFLFFDIGRTAQAFQDVATRL